MKSDCLFGKFPTMICSFFTSSSPSLIFFGDNIELTNTFTIVLDNENIFCCDINNIFFLRFFLSDSSNDEIASEAIEMMCKQVKKAYFSRKITNIFFDSFEKFFFLSRDQFLAHSDKRFR